MLLTTQNPVLDVPRRRFFTKIVKFRDFVDPTFKISQNGLNMMHFLRKSALRSRPNVQIFELKIPKKSLKTSILAK
jgi:hypothetical protein